MAHLFKAWCKCSTCGDAHWSYVSHHDKKDKNGLYLLNCEKHSKGTRKRNAPAKGQMSLPFMKG